MREPRYEKEDQRATTIHSKPGSSAAKAFDRRKTKTGWDIKEVEVGQVEPSGSLTAAEVAHLISLSVPVGLIPSLLARPKGSRPLTKEDIERALSKAKSGSHQDKQQDITKKLRAYYHELHKHLSNVHSSEFKASRVEDERPPSHKPVKEASFPGLVGDRAGLGATAEAVDVYTAYREMRSGVYHSRIQGNTSKKKFRRQ